MSIHALIRSDQLHHRLLLRDRGAHKGGWGIDEWVLEENTLARSLTANRSKHNTRPPFPVRPQHRAEQDVKALKTLTFATRSTDEKTFLHCPWKERGGKKERGCG